MSCRMSEERPSFRLAASRGQLVGLFFETKRTICVSHLRISRQAPNVQQIPLLLPTSWCIAMFVAFLRNNLHLRHLSLVKAPSHEFRLSESRESAMQRQSLVLHACQRARQPPDIVSRSALREPFLHRWCPLSLRAY